MDDITVPNRRQQLLRFRHERAGRALCPHFARHHHAAAGSGDPARQRRHSLRPRFGCNAAHLPVVVQRHAHRRRELQQSCPERRHGPQRGRLLGRHRQQPRRRHQPPRHPHCQRRPRDEPLHAVDRPEHILALRSLRPEPRRGLAFPHLRRLRLVQWTKRRPSASGSTRSASRCSASWSPTGTPTT